MYVSVHGLPVLAFPWHLVGFLYLARVPMSNKPALDELWSSVSPSQRTFERSQLSGLPEAARRYLTHAIAPGTPLASAVRLRMHGEIKLGRWLPFTAEQVIHWGRGMIWRATVRMYGMPITGFDRLLDGAGAMRWKLLGIIPIMTASGPEITRSAAGRVTAESVWLPSALCRDEVAWTGRMPCVRRSGSPLERKPARWRSPSPPMVGSRTCRCSGGAIRAAANSATMATSEFRRPQPTGCGLPPPSYGVSLPGNGDAGHPES